MTNSYKELLKQREALEHAIASAASKSCLKPLAKRVNWWLNLD